MSFTVTLGTVTVGSGGGGGGGAGTVGLSFVVANDVPLNALTIAIYERNSTTLIADSAQDLLRAENLTFDQIFPGGLFGACSFFVPRDATDSWPFKGGQRLVIRNGLTVVYEGIITNVGYEFGQGARQGRSIQAAGAWEQILGKRGWEKRWADNRMSEDVWKVVAETSTTKPDQGTFRRDNGILKLVPKGVAFLNTENIALIYTMPTGETIKRIKLSYDMQEAAQAWRLRVYNITGAANVWAVTASGTGTRDDTLGTPSQSVYLIFDALAGQTPTEDGTYYGQIDNAVSGANAFMVYSETGSINAQEIAKDIRAKVTDLNSDETNIGALTYTLEPFITNGWEWMNSILQRAVSYGDASFNSWYARLLESDRAATPDGKPVLELAQYPALTDYDYEVRVSDPNIEGDFKVVKDSADVYNWIVLVYRDGNGREIRVTPDDDANLKDTTSITEYGQREYVIDAGQATATTAKNWARRFLAAAKDAKFYVSGPITVKGYIKGNAGNLVPAANIRAGQRVKIVNFLTDEVGVTGAGLTFHITQMSYDDASQTARLSTGVPDNLAVFLARLAVGWN